MAGRQKKVGLDYFELDCHMDEKVELVEAEFGLKGFAVIVKLYQSIYSGLGYYCEWTPEISVLWAYRLGCSRSVVPGNVGSMCGECALSGFPQNFINEVVSAAIRRNIFSAELFNRYGILTSSGIQKRYLNAVSKREEVKLIKEYLLVSVGKNKKNVVINSISDGRNGKNDAGNTQSKEEKSKEEHNTMCTEQARALFEKLWKIYPLKKGKGSVSDAQKKKLLKIGFDEMKRALDRYVSYVDSEDFLHYKNGSTFFNSGYIDYLDANYEPEKRKPPKQDGWSGQYMQQDYDFEQLEKEILANG